MKSESPAARSGAHALSREEARELLRLPGEAFLSILASAATAASLGGSRPFTCGIINAKSGRCGEDCAFCAQSGRHATTTAVYPLLGEEALLERAEHLAAAGAAYMGIVASGVGPTARELDALCRTAERISRRVGIKLCASLGVLEGDQAFVLKQAGFTSYHHNLESSRSYYGKICTTHSYERRLETVIKAGAAGLRVCSGGIFGLGEDWEHRLELALTLRELHVDSIPVNFLIPIPGTSLEHAPGLEAREALAVIALFRLMHPARDIIICGGRAHTLGAWENSVFFAGANGLMVGDYLTSPGSSPAKDREMLRVLGLHGAPPLQETPQQLNEGRKGGEQWG